MRIPRTWVPSMARRIAELLLKEELIVHDVEAKALAEEIEPLLMDELMVEDRINDEVREILRKFDNDIDRGRMDYRKLFDMTKQKLVRERGIVL